MASGTELIRKAKEQIEEVDPKAVHDLLESRNGEVIVDADENNATQLGYDVVHVGFNASSGSLTQELFIDDVAVATQPIGCP